MGSLLMTAPKQATGEVAGPPVSVSESRRRRSRYFQVRAGRRPLVPSRFVFRVASSARWPFVGLARDGHVAVRACGLRT